jgi:OMF family outer membrane factor
MVTYRKIKQKKIELANSSIQLNMVEEQNLMNIDNAMQQRMVSYRTLDNALQNIALAQKIYDQTILQQQEGIASVTEVILADNAISSAQQNYLSALVDYLKADLELRKLTGNISIN